MGSAIQQICALSVICGLFCAILALIPVLLHVLQSALSRKLPDEDLLFLLGVIIAFCIREAMGAAIASILYRLMQIMEAYAVARGETGLDRLRDSLPEKAMLLIGEETMELAPENVNPGQRGTAAASL